MDAGRGICICKSCAPHVDEHAPKPWTEVRVCDYAIDPVTQHAHMGGSCNFHPKWQDRDTGILYNSSRIEILKSIIQEGETVADNSGPVSDSCAVAPDTSGPVTDSQALTCVMGRPFHEFATAVAALSDSEEMVLALVHPLVQVYTIPKTGQLAYVGHVCNFRQKVSAFLSSLPTLPSDMPFVMVRPRVFKNQRSPKAPFKINIDRMG